MLELILTGTVQTGVTVKGENV